MAKRFVLLLGCLLSSLPSAWGADTPLDLLKRGCGTDELKQQVDRARPEDLNAADEEGRTALFYSRHLGATMLLLAGADANARDHSGRTPAFRVGSRSDDVAFPIMLELFALAGTDVNARDKEGCTLLAWAAHEDNVPAAKLLLLLGADPAPGNVPADRTPQFFALRQHDDKLADLLRAGPRSPADNAADADASPDQKLAAAVLAARLGPVNDALAAGASINARDKDGATALFRAVAERRAGVAALLLLKGADPNLARNDGMTPLMQCATGFDMASERMLVELLVARADVNVTAKNGSTALSQAVHSSNNTAAQWLIWRGADLNVHSPDGTLAQGASLNPEWPSMIELLKRAGVEEEKSPLTQARGFGLFEAVKAGNLAGVEAELRNGTPADVIGRYDQTPLEWAIARDHFDVVDLLLRHGADINHQHRYNGEHILHTLGGNAQPGDVNAPRMIAEVLKRGGNPNLTMKDGCTPLMVAARKGVTGETMELLVQVTDNLNARDKEGLTALGLARQHGHAESARLLAARGAAE